MPFGFNIEQNMPSYQKIESETKDAEPTEDYINPFLLKRAINEKHQEVVMKEILYTGEITDLEISLRQLLNFVNSIAKAIDGVFQNDGANTVNGMDIQSFRDYFIGKVGKSSTSAVRKNVLKSESEGGSKDVLATSIPKVVAKASHYLNLFGRAPEYKIDQGDFRCSHNGDDESAAIHIRARDLRRLDFIFSPIDEPSVWVRRHAVLFSFDPIRAVVMSSRIIVIIPPGGMDEVLKTLQLHMSEWLHSNLEGLRGCDDGSPSPSASEPLHLSIPFESHAYESILTTVNDIHFRRYERLNEEVQAVLLYFKAESGSILPYEIQEKMRDLKNEVSSMVGKMAAFNRALNLLIQDDEAMALMNLSKLRKDPTLYKTPLRKEIMMAHEEIEELLEAYLMDSNSLEAKLGYLLVTIDNAEDLVFLKLDVSRNKLLTAHMTLAVIGVSISFSAYITGVFGMNLDNVREIQPVKGSFGTIFLITFGSIILSVYSFLSYYRHTGVIPLKVRVDQREVKLLKKEYSCENYNKNQNAFKYIQKDTDSSPSPSAISTSFINIDSSPCPFTINTTINADEDGSEDSTLRPNRWIYGNHSKSKYNPKLVYGT
jgi:magnesium transporter